MAGLRIGRGLVWLRWHVHGEWEDRKAEGDGDRSHGLGGLWRGAELRRSYLLLADEDTGLDGVTRAAGGNAKGSLAGLALTPYYAPAPSLQSCQQASNFPSCYHSQSP